VNHELSEKLATYARQVESGLRRAVPRTDGDLLSEAAWYHLESGGKRLRPALCLATCAALGGNPEEALDFAVAVELLHNMLLVHDDLEDRDRARRDRPTVWVRYGEANAINVGDYLLGLAYRSILRSPVSGDIRLALLDAFTFAYVQTVVGQSLDIGGRADPRFTLERYEDMVTRKTGYYLVLGMVGGAVVAKSPPIIMERLWQFGRFAGPAFQVRDDLLDLTVGKGRSGRIGCDIEEGKPSILYAHALQHAAPAERERLVAIMAAPRDQTGPEDVAWVIQLYRKTGAIEFAQKYADEKIARAQEIISGLPLRERETLSRLTDFLITRAT